MSPSDIAKVDLGNCSRSLASRQVHALSHGLDRRHFRGAKGQLQSLRLSGQGTSCLLALGLLLWKASSASAPTTRCPHHPLTFCGHRANRGVQQHITHLTSCFFCASPEPAFVQRVDLAVLVPHGRWWPDAGRCGEGGLLHREALC